MIKIGAIVPWESTDAAFTGGVDYVEPTIVNNVAVRGDDGWRLREEYRGGRYRSFAVLVPGDLALSDPAFPREDITRYLRQTLDCVAQVALPAARVVFGSGAARNIADGVDRSAGEARFAEIVGEAVALGRARGLTIVLEPLNKRETNLLNTIEECVAFTAAHDLGDVPIVADFYHMSLEGEPLEVLHRYAGRIGHAHIADSDRLPPGDGTWPVAEFVRTLRDIGYPGSLSMECHWTDVESDVRRALNLLRTPA